MSLPLSNLSEDVISKLIKVRGSRVIDADGLEVPGLGKLRLNDVDCPEYDQSWGAEAKLALKNLIEERCVYLEIHGKCPYGRILVTVYIKQDSKFMNVNERMVMCGHGHVLNQELTRLPNNRQLRLYELQAWAKSKGVGLWKFRNIILPWIHRLSKEALLKT